MNSSYNTATKLECNRNAGGHTWTNWRVYLSEFATMIFK